MTIIALPAFNDNYIWTIINEATHSFICVDPGDASPVLNYAKSSQFSLQAILITHHHLDHTGGIAELLQAFPNVIVYAPDDNRITSEKFIVRDGDYLSMDNVSFRVISTPGHTATHVCYYEPQQEWLFCGDTLFSAGCGRVFEGTIKQLFDSLNILKNLPEHTKVYCGHEYTRQNLLFAAIIEPDNEAALSYAQYLKANPLLCSLPSSIALEKEINPFLRTDTTSLKAFAKVEGLNPEDHLSIFQRLRYLKDEFI